MFNSVLPSVTEAVAASPDQNCDWFKLLLNQYIKPGDEVFSYGTNLRI